MRNPIYGLIGSIAGWKTKRKIIVFTSDDWGCVRLKSVEERNRLIKNGFDMSRNRFDRFDSLESDKDIESLFEILLKFKDYKGNNPVITAAVNVANPDFRKIRENHFLNYYFEDLLETYKRYPHHDKVLQYFQTGIKEKIFYPEFHGREHLNIKRWIEFLKDEQGIVRKAFEAEFFFLGGQYLPDKSKILDAAFDIDRLSDLPEQAEIIQSGIKIFRSLFGYGPLYFIAPSLIFHPDLEKSFKDTSIRIIDVPKFRKYPLGNGKKGNRIHYLGQKNSSGQFYFTRNAVFEPNLNDNSDCVDECLADIKMAFMWNNPAIISNHRTSFMGGIDIKNRDKGLSSFDKLLKAILKAWPETEFLTASQLCELF